MKKQSLPSPRPKKPTAAEKRAAEKLAREKEEATFEETRQISWLTIWSKVLRLEVMSKKLQAETERSGEESFAELHDWWFGQFSVDAAKEEFKAYGSGHNGATGGVVNQANLTLSGFQRIQDGIDDMLSNLQAHLVNRENQRLEALEDARLRKELLGRLTDKEKSLLGLNY